MGSASIKSARVLAAVQAIVLNHMEPSVGRSALLAGYAALALAVCMLVPIPKSLGDWTVWVLHVQLRRRGNDGS